MVLENFILEFQTAENTINYITGQTIVTGITNNLFSIIPIGIVTLIIILILKSK